MARISEFVRTLPGVAIRSIERVLSDPYSTETTVIIRSSDPVDVSDLTPLSIITPSKLNTLWTAVARKNSDAWATVSEVDAYIAGISERCDAVVSSTARSINKNQSVLNGIFLSAGRRESIDAMYTETFSGFENTDRELTTASIESGRLVLSPLSVGVVNGVWKARAVHPQNATVSIDENTGSITAKSVSTVGASVQEHLMLTLAYELNSPSLMTTVVIGASGSSVAGVRIINAAGEMTEIDVSRRIETTDTVTVNFDRTPVTSVEVDIIQRHFTIDTYSVAPAGNAANRIIKKLIKEEPVGSATNMTGHGSHDKIIDRIKKMAAKHVHSRSTHLHRKRKSKIPSDRVEFVSEASFSITAPAINIYDLKRESTGTWVSTPFTIDGDARSISLSVEQADDSDVNVTWYLSVEGHQWVPVVPENARIVTGEMLDLDFSLTGQLDYPASAEEDIRVHGVPEDCIITTMKNNTGHVTALQFSKTNGGPVTVDYTTAFSGIVDLEEIGQSTGGVRVIDAMSGGSLGEHFPEVHGSVTLRNTPHGNADIYIDGVLATQIADDMWFTDPSLSEDGVVYYKMVGRTVFVDGDAKNVSAYYKYAQTSIRIKAELESSSAEQGRTPMVDSLTVGVKTMSV